jgi:acetyltransferase-like isoleucine patch superfamily enzyme/glycosyltransferase involved in cell wall biosynthesis
MSQEPILSILIPTFNRSQYLRKLLFQLSRETKGLEAWVRIIISDNCSSDETPTTVLEFLAGNPHFASVRQDSNIGPDRNFLAVMENCNTAYFWMIGDDDLPRSGVIRLLIDYLNREKPTLVYLPSLWRSIINASDLPEIESISPKVLGPIDYASTIHVYTTYISAWIVNMDALRDQGVDSKRLAKGIGTSFVQLGWILPLLRMSSKLTLIDETCVLATGGNTGGYRILTTFCVNYPDFVRRTFPFEDRMRSALLAPFAKSYLPSLIDSVKAGDFIQTPQESAVIPKAILRLGWYREFWRYTLPALVRSAPHKSEPTHSRVSTTLFGRFKRKVKRSIRAKVQPIYAKIMRRVALDLAADLELQRAEGNRRRIDEEIRKFRQAGERIELPLDTEIVGHQFLSIGSNFNATRGLRLHCWQTQTFEGMSCPSLIIGDRVFFNREAYISCAKIITIGSDSLFGSNVLITDNYHGSTKLADLSRLKSPLSCPAIIEIEQGVWVGNNVCILPGAHLGKGCIIGANSVVNSRIPAFSVAVGAPARVIATLQLQE